MKIFLSVIGVFVVVGLGLNALILRDRASAPQLSVVIPPDYCGELWVYLGHDPDGVAPTDQWERVLTPMADDTTILAQLPFPDENLVFTLIPSLEGVTPRIDRKSVSSWPHGGVHATLIGHEGCENPPVTSPDITISAQRAFEAQMEQ